jgi:hypothetical protein
MVLIKFHWDLTYLKPDLKQSDSGTSQALRHTAQTAQDITVRSVQNQFSTVQLFHEYTLPEMPEIPNIC